MHGPRKNPSTKNPSTKDVALMETALAEAGLRAGGFLSATRSLFTYSNSRGRHAGDSGEARGCYSSVVSVSKGAAAG